MAKTVFKQLSQTGVGKEIPIPIPRLEKMTPGPKHGSARNRNSLVLLGVTLLWHMAQWVSRAPSHHTLPSFLNLNGRLQIWTQAIWITLQLHIKSLKFLSLLGTLKIDSLPFCWKILKIRYINFSQVSRLCLYSKTVMKHKMILNHRNCLIMVKLQLSATEFLYERVKVKVGKNSLSILDLNSRSKFVLQMSLCVRSHFLFL